MENKISYGRNIQKCRMCKSKNLYQFLDLGYAPPSDAILSPEELNEPEIFFPLKVLQCIDCGLTQLSYAPDPRLLYGDKYKYETSMTETGKAHFFALADSIIQKFNLKKGSFVVDIGSNVGVTLERFKNKGMNILGLDPAPIICEIANKRGIETWQEFLNTEVASRIVSEKGKAKIVTGTNVFAHIDNKEWFMSALDVLLAEDGIFIFEVPYFVDLIENLEYDTIYPEHLEFLSIKPLVEFFGKHDMVIFDVERYEIHGKSIRVFVARKERKPVSENVNKLIILENEKGIYKKEVLDDFARKVQKHREELTGLLRNLKSKGKKIVGISAPAKGNNLLNYCKIGTDLIDYITEKSEIKRGHYTPGTHIPIVGEDKILEDQPDYGIIFAWNFADEIMKNNEEFSKRGGKFIIPIPKLTIK